MKKKVIFIIIILLLPYVYQNLNISISNNEEVSIYSFREPSLVQIKQSASLEYTDHLGPIAVIMAHHSTDYYQSKFNEFVSIVREFYPHVLFLNSTNYSEFTYLLEKYSDYSKYFGLYQDLIVITNPYPTNVTNAEASAFQYAFENGRATMLTGECYYYSSYYGRLEPDYINSLVAKYGLIFEYDELQNETDGSYYVVIQNWANTSLANMLSNNKLLKLEAYRFTHISINEIHNNTNGLSIYRIGIGDDQTITVKGTANYSDINAFIALENQNRGKMIVAGGSYWLRDTTITGHGIGALDNIQFLRNILDWFNESIKVYPVNISTPSKLPVNINGNVFITVKNFDSITRDVTVHISLLGNSGPMANITEKDLGLLISGGEANFALSLNATSPGILLLNVTIEATNPLNASDIFTYSRIIPIEVVSLEVTVSPEKAILSLYKKSFINVTVNITNPTPVDAIDVRLYISIGEGINVDPGNIIEIGNISAGSFISTNVNISFSRNGTFRIIFKANASNFKNTTPDEIVVTVYNIVVLFDSAHQDYYTYTKFTDLIQYLKQFFGVIILNKTFSETLLSVASLIIMPRVDVAFTAEEIELLKDYVANGSSILIMGDGEYDEDGAYYYFDPTYINAFVSYYGVEFLQGQVNDSSAQYADWVDDLILDLNDLSKVLGLSPFNCCFVYTPYICLFFAYMS